MQNRLCARPTAEQFSTQNDFDADVPVLSCNHITFDFLFPYLILMEKTSILLAYLPSDPYKQME